MIALKWQLPLLVLAVGVVLWLLSPILSPFVAALLLAWLGNPLVERLERAGRKRSTAVLLVFMLMFLLLALVLMVLLPLLWNQGLALIHGLPRLQEWFHGIALPWIAEKLDKNVVDLFNPSATSQAIQENWRQIGGFATQVLAYISKSGLAIILILSNLVLLPILTFYFLRDWPMMLQSLHRLIPRPLAAKAAQLAQESDSVLCAFLRGQMLVMVILGAIYGLGLWAIGLDSGLLIGFIAGMVSFVPYLGALVGVVAAVIATLIQHGDITHLLGVAAVFVVGQLIESYVLTPKLVGDRIGLHPVAVIFAIMAGGQLFGFIGVLGALPMAAVLNVVFKHLHARYLKSRVYGEPIAVATPDEPVRPDV